MAVPEHQPPRDPAATPVAEPLTVARFRDQPTRSFAEWYELWERDLEFPIESHRPGPIGRFLVWWKRLLRPLVTVPQADLWDRQRAFNLVLLEVLQREREHAERQLQDLGRRHADLAARVDALLARGFDEVMRYNDALYFRVDQKLDRARRETAELTAQLRAALAVAPRASAEVRREQRELLDEGRYLALEERHRGRRSDIRDRVARYLPDLAGRAPVLDLGCGRGEALEALREHGVAARGVDQSAEMVRRCSELGLEAERGDLLTALGETAPSSWGAIVSFHVVEHLPAAAVDSLVDLAWRALRPGGLLLLETPNPLSLVAGASRFWIDPTHRRPVHPERLRALLVSAGFEVEIRPCAPFPDADRLPEVTLPAGADEQLARLVWEINAVRDRLDDLLHGHQDYAALGLKPA